MNVGEEVGEQAEEEVGKEVGEAGVDEKLGIGVDEAGET